MKFIILFSLLSFTHSFSHSSHHHAHHKNQHKANIQEVKSNARAKIFHLVNQKKIEKSWRRAEVISASKKTFGKKLEWVVIAENKKAKEKLKSKLYIFLNLSGDFIAANFTGK